MRFRSNVFWYLRLAMLRSFPTRFVEVINTDHHKQTLKILLELLDYKNTPHLLNLLKVFMTNRRAEPSHETLAVEGVSRCFPWGQSPFLRIHHTCLAACK